MSVSIPAKRAVSLMGISMFCFPIYPMHGVTIINEVKKKNFGRGVGSHNVVRPGKKKKEIPRNISKTSLHCEQFLTNSNAFLSPKDQLSLKIAKMSLQKATFPSRLQNLPGVSFPDSTFSSSMDERVPLCHTSTNTIWN